MLAGLLALPLLGMRTGEVAARPTKTPKAGSGSGASGSAYDVIAAVNQVRASHGLAPFQINGALMAAAQAHSAYQASTGSISHSGSGGSTPGSRAAAAGYSGGVIENIYGGMNASPQQAVAWWQTDSLHLGTLLSTRHSDVGAGVASSGGVVYYTLDVGTGTGGTGSLSGSTGAATQAASGSSALAPAAALAFNPVVLATPNADGSIVHVVKEGQTLWTIAASYKIALQDLLQLNGFTNDTFIYPGNKILIKPAGSTTAVSAAASVEVTTAISETVGIQTGTPDTTGKGAQLRKTPAGALPETRAATRVAMTISLASAAPVGLAPTPTAPPPKPASSGPDPLLLVVAGLVFGGAGLLVVGNVLKRGES